MSTERRRTAVASACPTVRTWRSTAISLTGSGGDSRSCCPFVCGTAAFRVLVTEAIPALTPTPARRVTSSIRYL